MKLQRSKIDTLIFDMDGVITSEYIYWKAAALTVYELLYSHRYFGHQDLDKLWCRKNVSLIYDTVFCGGRTVTAVKHLGVNTNWDLAYLVFCVSTYLEPELTSFDLHHFEAVCMFIENIKIGPPALYTAAEGLAASASVVEIGYFKRTTGGLWKCLIECFQRWFHGDVEIKGLKLEEEPVLPLKEIEKTLRTLNQEGYILGVGTGRPKEEILFPLQMWGLDQYFDTKYCASYDEVSAAEKSLTPEQPLAKPHPFVFQKAAFGHLLSDEEIYYGKIPFQWPKKCLVIGDAPSDLLAARAGGFPFAAVLTGIEGKNARPYFEENQAELILNSMLELINNDN
ncbi:HAD family hydrolase [Ructibacterium gallinarum]|uniref:HAD family hydrolase n=1 Tax=Ructibacterium gallinarum TaxID=2779355 RepID=A0A9D5M122_9FIRM|nr:HAD family hydrolase [Ructibacterium gallinarum]MBE5040320.1 HAD family hydrolase [Ructibacterium gallinarum]